MMKIYSNLFLLFFLLIFLFVGVYAQDTTEPDIADETGSSFAERNTKSDIGEDSGSSRYVFDCAAAFCFEGYDCVQGEGCVLREGTNFGNCGDEESYDHVSGTCRGIDFNYVDNYKPKGFFGGFVDKLKIAFADEEDRVKLMTVVGAGHIADFERAVLDGDEDAIFDSVKNIETYFAKSGTYLEEYADSVDYDPGFVPGDRNSPYNNYMELRWSEMQNIDKFNEIKGVLLEKVESGEISGEIVDQAVNEVERSMGELVFNLEDTREEIVDKTVESSNGEITELEIDYYSRFTDGESGAEDRFYRDFVTSDDIADSSLQLDILKQEITKSDERDISDVDNLLLRAQIEHQEARDDLAAGDYQGCFEHYQTADYLVDSIDRYVDNGESALRDVHESVDDNFGEINQNIEEENRQIVEDYETEGVRNRIVENYGYQVDVDKEFTKATEIVAVVDVVAGFEEVELAKYGYEGMSVEEAQDEVEQSKAQEFAYAAGVKWFPPGYFTLGDEDGDGLEDDPSYGGGYMQRIDYPVYSGEVDSFVVGENGYSWESPFGNTYVSNHPADYNPGRYDRGYENFNYDYETDDGTFNVNLVGCGVAFTMPDGTEESINYGNVARTLTAVGGTEFRYSPVGVDVISNGGATRWVINPAFTDEEGGAVYMDLASGLIYSPEIGHYEPAVYNSETDTFNYRVGQSEVDFDIDTNTFVIDGTTTITPPVPVAPIGLGDSDGDGVIVLQNGDTWERNAEDSLWEYTRTDDDGEVETGIVTEAPNYLYGVTDDGEVINVDGEIVDSAEFAGETWTETNSGLWVSENRIVYNPITGDTLNSEGDIVGVGVDGGSVWDERLRPGGIYDSSGSEVSRNTFRTDSRYVFDPLRGPTGGYVSVPRSGIFGYDPANPLTREQILPDGTTKAWTMDGGGRWYTTGANGEKDYPGYQNYYREEDFAKVGTRVTVDGKEYYVDREKGWATTDAEGNVYAVGSPRGYPSSEVNVRGGYGVYDSYYHSGSEARDYNYFENGVIYYIPSSIDPRTLTAEQKEDYRVDNPYYGYDSAFGTNYGGPGVSGSSPFDPARNAEEGTQYEKDGVTYTYRTDVGWEYDNPETEKGSLVIGVPPGFYDEHPVTYPNNPYPGRYYDSGVYSGDYGRGSRTYYSGSGSYSSYGSYGAGATVGTTVVGDDGKTYIVTNEGWSVGGVQVSPPTVGGVQQPSSATGGYGGSYGCANGACGGGYGGYSGGSGSTYGNYAPDGTYAQGGYYTSSSDGTTYTYTAPDGTTSTGTYSSGYSGGYSYGGYDSYSGTYYSGGYAGGSGAYYPGSSSSGGGYYGGGYDASGAYVGGSYGGYDSSGAYVGTGGGTYSSGTYSGSYSGSGTYASGSYTSPEGSTYSGSTSTSTSSSPESGSTSTSSSPEGGSTGGSTGGSAPSGSGYVVAEEDAQLQSGNWLTNLWKKFTGFFIRD